jgi:hypothetical protein
MKFDWLATGETAELYVGELTESKEPRSGSERKRARLGLGSHPPHSPVFEKSAELADFKRLAEHSSLKEFLKSVQSIDFAAFNK